MIRFSPETNIITTWARIREKSPVHHIIATLQVQFVKFFRPYYNIYLLASHNIIISRPPVVPYESRPRKRKGRTTTTLPAVEVVNGIGFQFLIFLFCRQTSPSSRSLRTISYCTHVIHMILCRIATA